MGIVFTKIHIGKVGIKEIYVSVPQRFTLFFGQICGIPRSPVGVSITANNASGSAELSEVLPQVLLSVVWFRLYIYLFQAQEYPEILTALLQTLF